MSTLPAISLYLANAAAPYYMSWFVFCLLRLASGDTTAISDSMAFLAIILSTHSSLISTLTRNVLGYSLLAVPAVSLSLLIGALLISVTSLRANEDLQSRQARGINPAKHCQPLLFPCRTTHTRILPKRHSFSYSYLLAGVPVGTTEGLCRYGSVLSVDTGTPSPTPATKGWFHIQASDYLHRGDEQLGLHAKLARYLHSEGVSDAEWHRAYLVTAPRFLGYSFNPVSFWYIYSATDQLVMMVLEVNNTSGERHMYLLKSASSDPTTNFSNAWEKDFYVSPFNSRDGSYTLAAADPFDTATQKHPLIDNRIVLRSPERRTKLVGRIFSDGLPEAPDVLSTWHTLRFIGGWWWVGLITLPRILWEAYRLYAWRRLAVFIRPEVALTSISRAPSTIEGHLERFFRQYLHHLVSRTEQSVRVTYTPIADLGGPETMLSRSAKKNPPASPLSSIRVTSPAFYSRFASYDDPFKALHGEALDPDDKSKTARIVSPQALLSLLLLPPLNHAQGDEATPAGIGRSGATIGWHFLRALRCPPSAPSYPGPKPGPDTGYANKDVRLKRFSTWDEYVMRNCSDSRLYRRCLIKLFLAQRFGLGFTELVELFDLLLRVCLIGVAPGVTPRHLLGPSWLDVMLKVVGFNAVHIWSAIKLAF